MNANLIVSGFREKNMSTMRQEELPDAQSWLNNKQALQLFGPFLQLIHTCSSVKGTGVSGRLVHRIEAFTCRYSGAGLSDEIVSTTTMANSKSSARIQGAKLG